MIVFSANNDANIEFIVFRELTAVGCWKMVMNDHMTIAS